MTRRSPPPRPPGDASRDASPAALAGALAVILLAAVAAFQPALHGGFVWDDRLLLLDNPDYRGLSGERLRWMLTTLRSGHYQPLTWLTYAFDFELWGLDPDGYRLTNVVLHVVGVLLAFLLARRLLLASGARHAAWVALAAALVWGVHPLRVEVVAWAAGRGDLLAAVFLFASTWLYLRASEAGASRRPWLVACWLAFVAGLASKASVMSLPLVLLVLDAWPLRRFDDPSSRRARLRAAVLEKLPFLAVSVVSGLVDIAARSRHSLLGLEEHGLLQRVMQAAGGVVQYPLHTLAPVGLSPLYELHLGFDPLAPRYLAAVAACVGVTAALLGLRRRFPAALAAWTAYVLLVGPVTGVLQSGVQGSADRYAHLTTFPLVLLVVAGAARLGERRSSRLVGVGAALVLLVGLAIARTRGQCRVWRDEVALWEHVRALDPQSITARYNLGQVYAQAGRDAEALVELDATLRLDPDHGGAWGVRANVRAATGDLPGALADLDEHVRRQPQDFRGWSNRGLVRERLGDAEGALEDYGRALALAPDRAEVRLQRASLLLASGRRDEARADLEGVLAQTPPGDPRRLELEALLRQLRASGETPR